MLGHLDKLENHPIYYTRTQHNFIIIDPSREGKFNSGDVIEAGIYLLKNFKQELLGLPTLISYSEATDPTKKYVKP